jgi:predicted RecB family nuclease
VTEETSRPALAATSGDIPDFAAGHPNMAASPERRATGENPLMTTRYDVSQVPLQGAYVAKQCPVRAQNDTIQPSEALPPDAFTERLFAAGKAFEAEVVTEILGLHSGVVVVEGEDPPACQAATVAAMAAGAASIVNAWLPADLASRRVGKPDLLVAAANGGYRPIDVKWHMNLEPAISKGSALPGLCSGLNSLTLEGALLDDGLAARRREGDVLQLAHYQRMLEAAGYAASDGRWAGIIGTERQVVWYDLDTPIWRTPSSSGKTKLRSTMERYDFEFGFRLDVIAVAGQHKLDSSVELLTVPVKISECEACPWWDYCRPQLTAGAGDVSLLPRVGYRLWRVHQDHGVTDRAALAALDTRTAQLIAAGVDVNTLRSVCSGFAPDHPIADVASAKQRPALGGIGIRTVGDLMSLDERTASYFGSSISGLVEQIDQARAALGPKPVYRRRGVDTVVVPRADVEVDIDMENVEEGCYLWGTLVTDRSVTDLEVPRYQAFVTWEPLTTGIEAMNSSRFWRWLTDLRRQTHNAGRTFRAFCYNANAENQFLRRLALSTGRVDEVEAFVASDEWIDLLRVFDSQLVTGRGSGLKLTAPLAGVTWAVDDPGGTNAMNHYDVAVGDGPRATHAREWLLSYNQGDVEATLALREWMGSAVLPPVAVLAPAVLIREGHQKRTGSGAPLQNNVSSKRVTTIRSRMSGVPSAPAPILWTDIQLRANRFAAEWKDETRERANKDSFWDEFFAVFGVRRRSVAVYEEYAKRASTGRGGFMDVFWPGVIAVEHKSAGEDLLKAMRQLLDYLPLLPADRHPRLLVVSDFAQMVVRDLDEDTEVTFPLGELSAHLHTFAVVTGRTRRRVSDRDEVEVNLNATHLLRILNDELKASGYHGHALRVFLVRVLFALFADDTEVWEHDLFHFWLIDKTRDDGVDLGPALAHLWQVLNTPIPARSPNLDDDLVEFAYINGGLFAETLPIPDCNRAMRDSLLECCLFDWSAISPAIFGSLFQEVMTPVERRRIGAHYTSEQNILRTIEPLFLSNLRSELAAATSRPALRQFREKLASLTFMDPACGCGNFLVIAYRELRRLETECLRRLRDRDKRAAAGQQVMDVTIDSQVRVGQFYGIEIEEFPVRIAETAMYLMDHLENRALSREFGGYYVRFPIADTAHIHHANALRIDWNDVVPSSRCDYVFGNPPFVGMSLMNAQQQADNRIVFATDDASGLRTGRLDYVACWYAKAIRYGSARRIRYAYVSTNSMSQGEQARTLGALLTKHGFTIEFAHRTFAWTSEASGKAHVHCVIVGFTADEAGRQRLLYDYPDAQGPPVPYRAANINVYLADAPNVIVRKQRRPFIQVASPTEGSRPEDGGGLIVSDEEADEMRQSDPTAAAYLRRLIGAREMLSGSRRWCLWLMDADMSEVQNSPTIRARLKIVRAARLAAIANTTSESRKQNLTRLAARPTLFTAIRQPRGEYLCIPAHSSATRRIVPMAMFGPEDIAHNSTLTIDGAPMWLFGILQSAMFMAWIRTVGGRLKSDLRIEADLCFNSFPFPDGVPQRSAQIDDALSEVLAVRERYSDSSLADLYQPLTMPPELSTAHDRLDKAVDVLYAPRRRFNSDVDRLAVLFERYAHLIRLEDAGRA